MNASGFRSCFRDLLEMTDVAGLALFSCGGNSGRVAAPQAIFSQGIDTDSLLPLVEAASEAAEAELVFEHGRLYLRRTKVGTLVVQLDPFASVALVRLQCDVLLPDLEKRANGRRWRWSRPGG